MFIKRDTSSFSKFLKPYIRSVILIFFLEILTVLCAVLIPIFLGKIIHSLETNLATAKLLTTYFLASILLYFIWDMLNIFTEVNFSKVNKSIQNDIRTSCYKTIFNAKMETIYSASEGEIINKVIRDTEKLEKAFSNFFYLILSIIHVFALFLVMFRISFILTSIILVFFIIIAILQRTFSHSLEKLYSKYKVSEENLLTDFKNFISGILSIKVFGIQSKCVELLNRRNQTNLKNYIELNKKASTSKNINFFIISVFRVITLFAGGLLYIHNKIYIGSIFTMYSFAIQLSTQLRTIIEIDIVLKDVKTSLYRIEALSKDFDSKDIENNKIISIDNIEFKRLSFKYDDKVLFSDLIFRAKKNDVVAIKGSNGSGKTTLTNIICGFYKQNDVYINGISQKHFSENEIIKRVSYVPQNIHLFPTTIMENISSFGKVPERKVYEICKDLGIHEKILSLSNGYSTLINDRNLNLSGGEKQIICIARALLKDCDILILDEINSFLDKDMEISIISNLSKYFEGKIVFIISHKEEILKLCNLEININDFKENNRKSIVTN